MYRAPCLPYTVSMLGPSDIGLRSGQTRSDYSVTEYSPTAIATCCKPRSDLTVLVLTRAIPSSKLQQGICDVLGSAEVKLVTRMSLMVSTRGAILAERKCTIGCYFVSRHNL